MLEQAFSSYIIYESYFILLLLNTKLMIQQKDPFGWRAVAKLQQHVRYL